MNENLLRGELRQACVEAGSQRAWALRHGFSSPYVSDVLSGRREISDNLARALGYRRVVSWEPVARSLRTVAIGTTAQGNGS